MRGAHPGPPQGVPVLNMQVPGGSWAAAAAAAAAQQQQQRGQPHQPQGHPVYTFHAQSGVQMNYLVSPMVVHGTLTEVPAVQVPN